MNIAPTIKYQPQQVVNGFKLKKHLAVKSLDLVAYEFWHLATGAKLLYLDKADTNKTFGVTF